MNKNAKHLPYIWITFHIIFNIYLHYNYFSRALFDAVLDVLYVAGGVTLTELRVPTSVMASVKNGVVLDCLYTLRPNSIGLVVAWYFNNSARPVYQWIPGQKPLSIGVFRHRANLDYKVSDDNDTMHR